MRSRNYLWSGRFFRSEPNQRRGAECGRVRHPCSYLFRSPRRPRRSTRGKKVRSFGSLKTKYPSGKPERGGPDDVANCISEVSRHRDSVVAHPVPECEI